MCSSDLVQARRKKNLSGEQRFVSETLQAPCVKVIVDKLGGVEAVSRRIEVVEGDLDQPLCGFSDEMVERFRGKVDLIINLAGVVDFDPPVTESFRPNVYGTQHLIDLVQKLGARLVHVSTSYVAGKQNGKIPEDRPIVG